MRMAQINPALRTNSVKVLDCIEWLLRQIKPANSDEQRTYYTDGVVVDRKRDTRRIVQDLAADVNSIGTLARIKEGNVKLLTGKKGIIGNAKRQLAGVDLVCWSVMQPPQDRAGITGDQLLGWLRHDVDVALSNDNDGNPAILRAAMSLVGESGPWGGPGLWGSVPSCFDLTITGSLAGPMSNFPYFMQVIQIEYLFDEFNPGRISGSL